MVRGFLSWRDIRVPLALQCVFQPSPLRGEGGRRPGEGVAGGERSDPPGHFPPSRRVCCHPFEIRYSFFGRARLLPSRVPAGATAGSFSSV